MRKLSLRTLLLPVAVVSPSFAGVIFSNLGPGGSLAANERG